MNKMKRICSVNHVVGFTKRYPDERCLITTITDQKRKKTKKIDNYWLRAGARTTFTRNFIPQA